MATLADSGKREEFDSGALRDREEGKGRCDLLPLRIVSNIIDDNKVDILGKLEDYRETCRIEYLYDVAEEFVDHWYRGDWTHALLELSIHFEDGAKKYSDDNWRKGMPCAIYIDSAARHYIKLLGRWTDEPHDRAFLWNVLCCIWTATNLPQYNYNPAKGEDK